MSEAINFDHKIANMPQIRVVKNYPKNRNNFLSVPIRVRELTHSLNNRPYFNQSTAMDSSSSRNSRQQSSQPS